MMEAVRRPLAGGLILAALMASTMLVGMAPAAADIDSVAPGSAFPGGQVTISGTVDILGLGQRVDLCWNVAGCDDLGSTTVGLLDPSYSLTVIVPDSEPGTHTIHACETLGGCDSTSVDVLGTATTTTVPAPTTAPPTAPPPSSTTTTRAPSTTSPPQTSTTTTISAPTTEVTGPTPASGPTSTSGPTGPDAGSADPADTTAPGDTTSTTEEGADQVLGITIDSEDPPQDGQRVTTTAPSTEEAPDVTSGSSEATLPDDVGELPVAADGGGWQLGSNAALYLTLWLLVMVVAVLVVFAFERGLGRRRRR